ncbi:hypothetical protein MMC18_007910 [Xylographa bjoerkii]|nr:hypothetical protein [Xylographa bjoerkii]
MTAQFVYKWFLACIQERSKNGEYPDDRVGYKQARTLDTRAAKAFRGVYEDFLIRREIAENLRSFGNRTNKGNGTAPGNQQKPNGSATSSPTTASPTNFNSPTNITSPNPTYPSSTMNNDNGFAEPQLEPEPPKFFFREKFAKLGVKGNFMPLAAQPKNVDLGDWLASQCHEQWRVLEKLLECVKEVDTTTGEPLCNRRDCPVMSAGRAHTYTWLNKNKDPIKVSAPDYIGMVQRWICGKLGNTDVFPTDPVYSAPADYFSSGLDTPSATTPIAAGPTTSAAPMAILAGHDWVGKSTGFPESFFNDCKTIFRQMFRLYAHIYHSHWLDPFYHIQSQNPPSSGWTDLNSCFVHFISVSKLFGLLSDRDMEPMQPLIDIWIANGSIPAEAAAGACVIVPHVQ